jgi:hypothetical protein
MYYLTSTAKVASFCFYFIFRGFLFFFFFFFWFILFLWWEGWNPGPYTCQASALPLSYTLALGWFVLKMIPGICLKPPYVSEIQVSAQTDQLIPLGHLHQLLNIRVWWLQTPLSVWARISQCLISVDHKGPQVLPCWLWALCGPSFREWPSKKLGWEYPLEGAMKGKG